MSQPNKLERMMNLLATLVHTGRPLHAREIQKIVGGYPESDESFYRQFERDKQLIRQLGITLSTSGDSGEFYQILKSDYYLELDLTPREKHALVLAASILLQDSYALAKLGGTIGAKGTYTSGSPSLGGDGTGSVPNKSDTNIASGSHLDLDSESNIFLEAIRQSSRIEFSYRGQNRVFEPWQVIVSRGHTYVHGFDVERCQQRRFRLDRIDDTPKLDETGSATYQREEIPDMQPWSFGGDNEKHRVVLRVKPAFADFASKKFPGAEIEDLGETGSELSFEASNFDNLIWHVLSLGPAAEIISPPALREQIVAQLKKVSEIVLDTAIDNETEEGQSVHSGVEENAESASGSQLQGDSQLQGGSQQQGESQRPAKRAVRYNTTERVWRLLVALPWLSEQKGWVDIDELSKRFNYPRPTLLRDLNQLAYVGIEPRTPDMLCDIVLDTEANKVKVLADRYFDRPLRLTPEEGLELISAGLALRTEPDKGRDALPTPPGQTATAPPGQGSAGYLYGDDLASAVEKISALFGLKPDEEIKVEIGVSSPAQIIELSSAIENRNIVQIQYLTPSRGELTKREIEPLLLQHGHGYWYLFAFCHKAEDMRTFRLDRISSIQLTGAQFDTEYNFETDLAQLYRSSGDSTKVTLEVDNEFFWLLEQLPLVEQTRSETDTSRITIEVSNLSWLTTLLVQLADNARVISSSPPLPKNLVSGYADSLLGLYN